MIRNGSRFRTTYGAEIQNGATLRTVIGSISNGATLRTSFATELSNGYTLHTKMLDKLVQQIFVTNPSYTNWNPGTVTLNPSYAGLDIPQLKPDIIVKISLMVDGSTVDLTPFLNTFNLDMPLGGKYTFDATFHQHSQGVSTNSDGVIPEGTSLAAYLSTYPSQLNPFFYGTGPFADKILHHRYDVSRQILISLTINHLGQTSTWYAPPMCPDTPKFDGYLLHWSGGDFTTVFEQEYQTMPDITPKSTTVYKAWDTIKAIGTQYNFINFTFKFPDFQIRQLTRQLGRPLDWIDKICKPYQAHRRWNGQQLEFITAPDPKDVYPLFFIKDFMITEGSYNMEMNTNWKNKFTISRLEDQGGVYGSQQCTGGHCIGRTLDITFDEPLDIAELMIKITGPAVMQDFVFFDTAGQPMVPYGFPVHRGGGKAKSVKGTFMPTYNQVTTGFTGPLLGGTVPYSADYGYSVFVKGGTTSTQAYSSSYTFKMTDTTGTVEKFGIRPEYENIEDEIIPTAAIAENYLKLVMAENLRKIWKLDLSTEYVNPFIKPGDCLAVTDYLTGMSNHKWLVEKIHIGMDDNGQVEQKFELYRGLN